MRAGYDTGMTKKVQAILEQALKLTRKERAEVIEGLATSLDDEADADLPPEWWDEIERRIEGILSGKTKGIPIARAMRRLRRSQDRDERPRDKAPAR